MAEQKRSGGCLSVFFGTFAALGIFAFVIAACVVIACVGLIALYAVGSDAQQDSAEAANAGFGTADKPIAAGEWVHFTEVDIRPIRVIRPADSMIENFNMFNDAPAAGAEFVLIEFEATCKVDACNPTGSGFRLVDNEGREWEEPIGLVLDSDLDAQAAVRGATFKGYQAFSIPKEAEIATIRIRWDLGAWLYTLPPVE